MRIQDLARRNGICASLIYRWRREQPTVRDSAQLVRFGSLRRARRYCGVFIARAAPTCGRLGIDEIELAGGVRVRVGEDVSLAALRRVISARGDDYPWSGRPHGSLPV